MKIVWYDNEGNPRSIMVGSSEVVEHMATLPIYLGLTPYDCTNTPYENEVNPDNFPPLSEFTGIPFQNL